MLHVAAQAPTRVEPAFWWVGMKSPELQLLVHHEGIRDYIPVAEYEGVYFNMPSGRNIWRHISSLLGVLQVLKKVGDDKGFQVTHGA